MPIFELESALSSSRSKPKGIKVSTKLWVALKAANLVEMMEVPEWDVFAPGMKLPFYKRIYLVVDPELEAVGNNFLIPPNVTTAAQTPTAKPLDAIAQNDSKSKARLEKYLAWRDNRWLGRS